MVMDKNIKKTRILLGILLILLGLTFNYKVIAFIFFREGPLLRKAVKLLISLADLGFIFAGSFLVAMRNKKITFKEIRVFFLNTIIFFIVPYLCMEAMVIKLNIIHPPKFKERHRLFYEFLEPDQDLGYKMKPGLRNFEIEWLEGLSAVYETDELGFRSLSNRKDALIAVAGDSVAFGVGVNYDKTWFDILSNRLNVPIANYAVGGYHPWQYNEIIRKFISKYPHRIIFYCIFANDLSNHHRIIKNRSRYYEYMGWKDYESGYPWIRRTVTYTALKKIDQAMERAFQYEKERTRIKNGLYLYRATGAEPDYLKKRTDLITEHFLRETISLTKDKSHLIVLLFPSKESVYREEYINAFTGFGEEYIKNEIEGYKRIIAFCKEKGVPAYDLTGGFREIKDDSVLFFNEDPHLNEKGNREAARIISRKFDL